MAVNWVSSKGVFFLVFTSQCRDVSDSMYYVLHFFLCRKIYSGKQIYKNFLTKTIYNYIHVINKKTKNKECT